MKIEKNGNKFLSCRNVHIREASSGDNEQDGQHNADANEAHEEQTEEDKV